MIKVEDLFKTYDGAVKSQAVGGVTFGVKPGETLGLLGPNGAGKSSTFNTIAMQEPRSFGSVHLMKTSIDKINLGKKGKSISLCPQHNSITEQLTVVENLKFIARIKGLTQVQTVKSLELVITTMGLFEFMNITAKNLSGGNKRKL